MSTALAAPKPRGAPVSSGSRLSRPYDALLDNRQEATAARLLELASHAQAAAALHVAALRVLAPLRPTALARLAYGRPRCTAHAHAQCTCTCTATPQM
jgi:hypothetical protein